MNDSWNKERVVAVARLAVTLAVTVAAGFGIALDADAIMTGVLCALSLGCYVWSWWSNNNLTKAAQDAQKYLDEIKAGSK